jgi:hypothetical protein
LGSRRKVHLLLGLIEPKWARTLNEVHMNGSMGHKPIDIANALCLSQLKLLVEVFADMRKQVRRDDSSGL